MPVLIRQGANGAARFELRGVAVIGRDKGCDIPIEDKRSSRRNTKVYSDGRNYLVEDLDSRNGTLLNGQRVSGVKVLRSGDQVQVGNTVFRFEDPNAPKPKAPRPSRRAALQADEAERTLLSFFSFILVVLVFGTTAVLSKLLFVMILRGL